MSNDVIAPEEDDRSALELLSETALLPYRIVTSRSAQRLYLSTVLLAAAAFILYGLAGIAYIAFYQAYIPSPSLSLPLFFDFDPIPQARTINDTQTTSFGPPIPTALVDIPSKTLMSGQEYDISIRLSLPRTRTNIDVGNFMLHLDLLGHALNPPNAYASSPQSDILKSSRRPAILRHIPPLIGTAKQVLGLGAYVLHLTSDHEELEIDMLQRTSFAKGWRNVPNAARVELRARETMQIYDASLKVRAKLGGIRRLMYEWRLTSFFALTGLFWMVEITFAIVVWAVSLHLFSQHEDIVTKLQSEQAAEGRDRTVKSEDEEEMSDTSRIFPTSSGQPPLRYSSPKVKAENADDEEGELISAEGLMEPAADADIEDEEEDAAEIKRESRDDSGLGTSLESSGGSKETMRRRRNR